MTDSLKLFNDGDPLTATDTNDNNQYLNGRINNCATTAYVNQQISSVNTNINNKVALSGNQTIAGTKTFSSSPILPTPSTGDNSTKGATTAFVNNTLGSNGLFCTTYINGTSWYREWFSNASKTTRVWLEQGGQVSVSSAWQNVSLLKSFSNTNYYIGGSATNNNKEAYTTAGNAAGCHAAFMGVTTAKFQVCTADDDSFNNSICRWYACGK